MQALVVLTGQMSSCSQQGSSLKGFMSGFLPAPLEAKSWLYAKRGLACLSCRAAEGLPVKLPLSLVPACLHLVDCSLGTVSEVHSNVPAFVGNQKRGCLLSLDTYLDY